MDLVSTLTAHVKLVAVGVGAVALFGGTATTISLADSSGPAPATPAGNPSPHATASEAADDANEPAEAPEAPDPTQSAGTDSGVRPTDTHGYCVSHAVAAARSHGASGKDVAAAAHSCSAPGAKHGKSAAAHGHGKG